MKDLFEIAQFFVDNPDEKEYEGYTVLSIKEGKVALNNGEGNVITVALPKPDGW